MCVCVCMYVCMYVCFMYVCMYVCIYVCMHICIVCMYVCVCVCMCMYVCVCVCMCMYVCMYVWQPKTDNTVTQNTAQHNRCQNQTADSTNIGIFINTQRRVRGRQRQCWKNGFEKVGLMGKFTKRKRIRRKYIKTSKIVIIIISSSSNSCKSIQDWSIYVSVGLTLSFFVEMPFLPLL
jgi:hypothetical protein